MTIRHHPELTTLAHFASGTLDKGRAFVVAAHVAGCRKCMALTRNFEEIGGVLLESIEPAKMSDAAADFMLAAVLREQKQPDSAQIVRHAVDQLDISTVLATYRDGPWRWAGPGVQVRSIARAPRGEARVYLLKAAPGTSLPEHTHSGSEMTLVLQGAYAHDGGRFVRGDFEEADASVEHQPVVEEQTCICLVAMDGKLRLKGLLKVMQPFIRL